MTNIGPSYGGPQFPAQESQTWQDPGEESFEDPSYQPDASGGQSVEDYGDQSAAEGYGDQSTDGYGDQSAAQGDSDTEGYGDQSSEGY